MNVPRPNWAHVYSDCGSSTDSMNELVTVTRETARLALDPLIEQQAAEAYHNRAAAIAELRSALSGEFGVMLEKQEACPACGEVKRWLYDAQICAACGHGDRYRKPKEPGMSAFREQARHLVASILVEGDWKQAEDMIAGALFTADAAAYQRGQRETRDAAAKAAHEQSFDAAVAVASLPIKEAPSGNRTLKKGP